MSRIAIIGAGMAGLTLAHELKTDAELVIFEKSRGLGGRISTRYADPYQFDHGAQYITATTDEFRQFLDSLHQDSIISAWNARVAHWRDGAVHDHAAWGHDKPHYIGLPKMNEIGKYLAKGLDVKRSVRIEALERVDDKWQLRDEKGQYYDGFDWVLFASPSVQTEALLPENCSFNADMKDVKMSGCFSLMLGFEQPLNLSWDMLRLEHETIQSIAVNSAKSGRPEGFSLMVQSDNAWADAHLDDDQEAVKKRLLDDVMHIIGSSVQPTHVAMHRWRYANVYTPARQPALLDSNNKLGACGDWCVKGKVEGAFVSAHALAQQWKDTR